MGRYALDPTKRAAIGQRLVQKVGTITYSGGATGSVTLPQSDYTVGLSIISGQTITTTGTSPVLAGYGAFGPLGTVSVATNGNRKPHSAPGAVTDFLARLRQDGYKSDLTSAPVTASQTGMAWTNHLRIPLTADVASPLDEGDFRGAWYTGDTALTMKVSLAMQAAAAVFSTVNSATIAGSWDVYREAYSAPDPSQNPLWLRNISFYHEFLFQTTQALKNGSTQVVLPLDLDYERIVLDFYTGSDADGTYAPADGLYTTVDLVINDKIHIFDVIAEAWFRFDEAYNNKMGTPPVGKMCIDFKPIAAQLRDVLPVDPDNVSTLKLNIVSTSTSNSVDVYTETVSDSPFAARWVAAAQAAAKAGA